MTQVALNLLGLRASEVRLAMVILAPVTRGPRSGGVIRNTDRETRPSTTYTPSSSSSSDYYHHVMITLMTTTEMQMPLRFCWEGMTATSSCKGRLSYTCCICPCFFVAS